VARIENVAHLFLVLPEALSELALAESRRPRRSCGRGRNQHGGQGLEEELHARDKKNREPQEALEKTWQIREAVLKEQEGELPRLKKEVEALPARVQKEIEATALQTRKEVEAHLEHQMILAKDEAEERPAELRAKALEEALACNTAYIATLEILAEAKQQV
jgi:hypothetical protein